MQRLLRPLAILVLALACAPDPNAPHRIPVAIGRAWSEAQRVELQGALDSLTALGVWFDEIPHTSEGFRGAGVDEASVLVLIPMQMSNCVDHGALYVDTGVWLSVYVDPECLRAPGALRAVVAHGVLHALALRRGFRGHLCVRAGDGPDCHPTIHGAAVLAPAPRIVDLSGSLREVFSDVPRSSTLSSADRELYRQLTTP